MKVQQRIWEIDFLRGIAVILMIIFHFVFDLNSYGLNIDTDIGLWYYIGKVSAIIFILISGICVIFSKNSLKHGLLILALGYILSVITYFNNSTFYIKFGILHFLGTSVTLYSFIRLINSKYLVVAALIFMYIGRVISDVTVDAVYLFPLGFTTKNFTSLDYYPIIPWIGIFILGVVVGRKIYLHKFGYIHFRETFINFLGRHSLAVYFIHQPILILILELTEFYIKK